MNQEVNVLALVKGKERYVFLYSDSNQSEMLRTFGRYASDPELSFSWYDAAVLSQKLRRKAQRNEVASLIASKKEGDGLQTLDEIELEIED
ncbi:MAG: hypothetical protein IJO46_15505 [Thermoguttaceae bacterium]|nr:hypothetical protein [Thermoguttaceae bacterium]